MTTEVERLVGLCDASFDEWYSAQRHQLTNEQVCRLIWTRGWQAAQQPMPSRAELIELWNLAMLETASGLDAMEYFARAILRPNAALSETPPEKGR